MNSGKFELPDGRHSASDILDYFEFIIKKHKTVTDSSLIRIFLNKIKNRTIFTITTGYYLELLTPGTMKLHGSNKSKITKDESSENLPHLEITKVASIHCNN